jgi:hypothetical protein
MAAQCNFGRALLEAQLGQLCPARVWTGVVHVLGLALVEIRAADPTEPATVRPAQELGRYAERKRLSGPRLQVEYLVLDVGGGQLLGPARLRDLPRVDLKPRRRLLQASHAWTYHPGLEADAEYVATASGARDAETRRNRSRLHWIRLPCQREWIDRNVEIQPTSLTSAQAQASEIECVSAKAHDAEGSGRFWLPLARFELPLDHLAGCVARQLVDHDDLTGNLVSGKPGPDLVLQIVLGQIRTRSKRDVRP